jgi:RHS repeat-associated protein
LSVESFPRSLIRKSPKADFELYPHHSAGSAEDLNAGPAYPSLTVTATDGSSSNQTGNILVPPATQNFSHDADGNLTNDSVWTYIWDGENRLIRMIAFTTVGPQQRLDFEYDWRGRRISKKVWNNTAGSGSPTVDQRFLYDGWNLLTIVDSSGAAAHSFQWGTDLSGSIQGAGGVGGLISMKVHSGGNAGTYFYSHDGNGNVIALANVANGSVAGAYEYNAFGETIRATGPLAQANPFRFSTKYQDSETDLLYYGYRYLAAWTGKWVSRDLIEERGGLNLHAFVANNAVHRIDPLGLDVDPKEDGKFSQFIWVCRHISNAYICTFYYYCSFLVKPGPSKDSAALSKCLQEAQTIWDTGCRQRDGFGGKLDDGCNAFKKCYDIFGPGTAGPGPVPGSPNFGDYPAAPGLGDLRPRGGLY